MKTIHKYELFVSKDNNIQMPKGAQILTSLIQHDKICMWTIVDDKADKEVRTITVYGTGHPMPDNTDVSDWIATVKDGNPMWHIFEHVS